MCRNTTHNRITAAEIAQALDAKRIRPGRWASCCPVPGHDDNSPSFSIAEGDTGPLVHCHAGCDKGEVIEALRAQGLWHKPTKAQLAARQRRQQADEQWRAIVRDRVNGRPPSQCPPYTRSIPASGEIQIITGEGAWELAKELRADGIHALVLPPGLPHLGFRWPVAGRDVLIVDLDYGSEAADTTGRFAHKLLSQWHADTVRAVGDFVPFFIDQTAAKAA